jgi:phage FluMu gp28-like protein
MARQPKQAAIGAKGWIEVPKILLPYQIEAIRLSHLYALFVSEKSRRTGLTYGFAADAVLTASPEAGAMDFYYIAYNLDMTREFIGYCADFAKAFDQTCETSEFLFNDGSEVGIKAFRIDFPSGKSIVALSSKPRSLRGKQGVVMIDEAAFHESLDELLKAAMALLMWGGRVIVISTHDGADNPFNELIEEIRAGKRKGIVQRIPLKEALEQGLYKRICLRTGKTWSAEAEALWEADLRSFYGDSADEELDVIPSRGSGTYMARATIEAACSKLFPVIRLTCPKGHELADLEWRDGWIAEWLEETITPLIAKMDPGKLSYFGDDFARNNDLSVMAVGQYDDMATLIVPFIIEMRNVPFREQKAVRSFVIEHLPIFAKANMDGRGNGQQMAEELGDDFGHDRIEAIKATQATYLTGFPRLKGRIEDRTILIPWAEGVIDDLRLIKLVRGVPMVVDRSDDKVDGDKAKRHGDSAIALMNLVCAADADFGPFDFESAGPRSGSTAQADVTESGFGTVRRASTDAFQTMDGSGF